MDFELEHVMSAADGFVTPVNKSFIPISFFAFDNLIVSFYSNVKLYIRNYRNPRDSELSIFYTWHIIALVERTGRTPHPKGGRSAGKTFHFSNALSAYILFFYYSV